MKIKQIASVVILLLLILLLAFLISKRAGDINSTNYYSNFEKHISSDDNPGKP